MTRRIRLLVSLIVVLSLTVAALATTATPAYIPIAAARQQPYKTTVTVMGLVTVPSGAFSSSSEDEGFAVQDQTAGIWVSVKTDLKLRIGQRVQVTGVLDVSAGKLQIQPASAAGVQRLPGSELRVATGHVGPATLGYIVTIEGTITAQGVVPDDKYGSKVYLDDGSGVAMVYLNASTDINAHAPYLKPGRVLRVTGFGNQYGTGSEATYEVDPRSRRDLTPR
jgi:DNA/RNA endonuclease YhcR with UshA esterase domain